MAARPKHSKPEIEKAVKHAEDNGFTVIYPWGHWGRIVCPLFTTDPMNACWSPVWSTPKNEGNHAKAIRRVVDRCDHEAKPETQEEGE